MILIVVSAKNMDFDKLVSVMGIIDMPLVSVRKRVIKLEAAGGQIANIAGTHTVTAFVNLCRNKIGTGTGKMVEI